MALPWQDEQYYWDMWNIPDDLMHDERERAEAAIVTAARIRYSYIQRQQTAQAETFATNLDTPTGAPAPTGSLKALSDFVKKNYGISWEELQTMDPTQQYQAWAGVQGAAKTPGEVPLSDQGLPSRPPMAPQEAAWMQWLAGEATRKMNEQSLANAMATMQYAFGTMRRGGAGSLAAFQQPMLGQMAQTQANTQYQEPDYSYWLTPVAYGNRSEPETPGPTITIPGTSQTIGQTVQSPMGRQPGEPLSTLGGGQTAQVSARDDYMRKTLGI